MNTPTNRRHLLKLAASLPLALPVVTLAKDSDVSGLSFHRVQNQVTDSGVRGDTLVIVDAGITNFDGEGYYLYPDWGKPVVYQVKSHNSRLAFYYPGTSQPLWSMTATQASSLFSGRVESIVDISADESRLTRLLAKENLQKLKVPAFPAAS